MVKIFQHYLPRSLTQLALVEVLILVASVYAGMYSHLTGMVSDMTIWPEQLLPTAVLFAGIVFAAMVVAGLYWDYQRRSLFEILARVVVGFLLGVVVVVGLYSAFPVAILPREVCLDVMVISFIGVLCIHAVHHLVSSSRVLTQRVLVVGAGAPARKLLQMEGAAVEFVEYLPASNRGACEIQQSSSSGGESLLEAVREHNADEIVVAFDDQRKAVPTDGLLECKLNGVVITDIPGFVERHFGKLDLDTLNRSRIIFSEGFRTSRLQSVLKRLIDLIVSVSLFVLTLPVMVCAALAILIESRGRGPLFYTQVRVGQGGQPFSIIKFRSMRTDAEKSGTPQYAEEDDPRVTKVGRILRDLRIDELPQIINVLRGEMSFVGPRPERPEYVQRYLANIPYYGLRHEFKPGITGWAQISYPYGSGERDAVEKLQYDLYYLKNYSILFDMNIVFQTAHIVLSGKGVR